MIRLVLGIVVALVGCAPPVRPTTPVLHPGTPESVGFSSPRLARIDTALAAWVADGTIPGAVGFVARRGTVVYHRATGYDDPATRKPLDRDGIFRIASQTKAITSLAVMMLYEEGKFALDDPVSKFIPEYANQRVLDRFDDKTGKYTTIAAKRGITVRDLLTHTAGLSYPYWGQPGFRLYTEQGLTLNHTFGFDEKGETLAGPMTRLAKAPLLHQPGERYTYGFSIDLLGYLVEIWSGMTLDQFFRTRIFEPLGMLDSYFNVPAEKAARLVAFFRADSAAPLAKREWLVFPTNDSLPLDYPRRTKVYFGGGGALSSTVADYAVFLQMMANQGEYRDRRILAPSTVRLMTTNQIGALAADKPGHKWGLGFSVVAEAGAGESAALPGTYGWGGALSTVFWVDPANELIILFYRQMWGRPRSDLDERFRALVYQALVSPSSAAAVNSAP